MNNTINTETKNKKGGTYYAVGTDNLICIRGSFNTVDKWVKHATWRGEYKIKKASPISDYIKDVLKFYAKNYIKTTSTYADVVAVTAKIDKNNQLICTDRDIKYVRHSNKYPSQKLFNISVYRKGDIYYIFNPRTCKRELAIQLPKNASRLGCTYGDLYTTPTTKKSIRKRYNDKHEFMGYAMYLPSHSGGLYWEHGETIEICLKEAENKVAYAKQWERDSLLSLVDTEKDRRFITLAFKFIRELRITRGDVKKLSGACDAGIKGFCNKFDIPKTQKEISIQKLLKLGIHDPHVRKTIVRKIMLIKRKKENSKQPVLV